MIVIDSIAADTELTHLIEQFSTPSGVVHATGLWGSSAPMVSAAVARAANRTVLLVTGHADHAENFREDLELFSGESWHLFPAWERLPGEGAASGEIEAERGRLCSRLLDATSDPSPANNVLLVTSIQALMQPVTSAIELRRHTITVSPGSVTTGTAKAGPGSPHAETFSPDGLLEWLVDRGYARLDLVESPGDVAKRGDILDVWILGDSEPSRIQFFDDEIEAIHRFDVSTQRSVEPLAGLTITAVPVGSDREPVETTDLFSLLPADALIILDNPAVIQEMGETIHARLGDSDQLIAVGNLLEAVVSFPQLHLSRFAPAATSDEQVFDFQVTSLMRLEGGSAEAVASLCELAAEREVHVICDNAGERDRLAEMIADRSIDPERVPRLAIGVMHRGFEWTRSGTVVVAHHEVFHRHRQTRRLRRVAASRPVETWTDLKPGDLVVHVVHGIAVYRGLQRLSKGTGGGGQREEFLTLEFANSAVLHVPSSQIELVQQYIGAGGKRPLLSKLGGQRWAKTKEQVADSVAELAESLLRVQAVRSNSSGIAYPPDTDWQREFEAAFLYEETEDQLHVADDIRADLLRSSPMDRLVCGDVGYGKTELAMRAAFKVVEFGRQVALLVPTTILAEQHYQTFTERLAEYPFRIECLSRFRSSKEQKKIVEALRKGQVDIVVGTHRLLSKDITFANLGLVIIDEEQRFGVAHKERLKAVRETVDVLTLTATPIPRTLHMSLMGVRDISSLQTPPVDRRAISTQVRSFDRAFIRDAILRELNRDGQVYFIHNFVQSIAEMAATVQQIVPEARVVYGHGQMKDGELESVMHRFMSREADVLVATTIIENGIDNPAANTIFINRAERFGLADLHQLRGRVGRSHQRAYCVLMLSPGRPPSGSAAKRLKAIEEFSELGAGFQLAMRDLEIRGAGNLLGHEQSGHIGAIGYAMYCRLVDQAVRRLKNEPDPLPDPVHVDLDVGAFIPSQYIQADRSRMEVYRRIANCFTVVELKQVEDDLLDAFGRFPAAVARLLDLADLRVRARAFGIASISLKTPDVIFQLSDPALAEPLFENAPGSIRVPDGRTIHMRLGANYLEPDTLVPILRRMFTKAVSLVEVGP